MKTIRQSLFLITTFLVSLSCKQGTVKTDTYGVMSYKCTQKALQDSINLRRLPIFQFGDNGIVKIKPKMDFELFNDTIYKYEFKGASLKLYSLKGKKELYNIPINKTNSKMITLFLNNPYIDQLDIIKTKQKD